MIDFLRAKATRTRLSEFVYIVLNALLPVVVFVLVRYVDPPYLAVGLVLLTKWRIFALRPRYWWANLKINTVDIVVGLSAVGLMYQAGPDMLTQVLVAGAYGVWLLVVKPRSSSRGVTLQAAIAQFVGLTAIFHFYLLPELVALAACWVVAYAAGRHFISDYDEQNIEIVAALWGLFVVQLCWLAWRWTLVYNIGLPLQIPQIALLVLVVAFSASRIYNAYKKGLLTPGLVRGAALFGGGLLAVILLFSSWDATI